MRFEVKGGGITAIVLAMTLLSGVVFVMGLLAGYDVGRQAQLDMAQLATSYPLQSAPSSAAASNSATPNTPAPATAPPATAGIAPTVASSPAGRSLASDSVSPERQPSQSNATTSRKRLASTSIPPAMESSSPAATDEDIGAATESETPEAGSESPEAPGNPEVESRHTVASTAPSVYHKPYNIQIEAAMDISGADQMMVRLRKLGYPSHLVPTKIAGQRWYKVEVGPYATVEEASSTEAQLRQKYDSTYGRAGSNNSASQTNVGDNSEE
jgi:cell division septation protein DedD